jgi:hypothetical protein
LLFLLRHLLPLLEPWTSHVWSLVASHTPSLAASPQAIIIIGLFFTLHLLSFYFKVQVWSYIGGEAFSRSYLCFVPIVELQFPNLKPLFPKHLTITLCHYEV